MINWTKDQKKAIDIRKSNLLVSAAAGSGKTAVLVERIINLVKKDKIDIDKFLIVTFTNAAANGMKQKIQKALTEEIRSDNTDKKFLRRQINLIGKAQISTLHSFCINVTRKNFHYLDIDPNFRIGDPSEVDIMLNESIDEVLENAYIKNDENFIKLVEGFTGNRNDSELLDILKEVYRFILSFPKPFKWLQDSVDMLNTTNEELLNSDWMKAIIENIDILVDGAKATLEEARKICLIDEEPIPYIDTINDDIQNLEFLMNGLSKDFNTFSESLYLLSHSRLKAIKKKDKERYDESNVIEIKELRDEYKKIINDIKKIVPDKKIEDYVKELSTMYPVMNSLNELIIQLEQVFKEKKLEKSILDFSDIEHYALELLSKDDVSKYYKNKFKYIFVDEYQDSNQVQETIINKIKQSDNLFMVGDVKQSIYRFRLADPSIFIGKYKTFKKNDDNVNVRVDLMSNFRSRKEIIDGINYIFSKIMSESIGEIDYNEEAFLYNGMEFDDSKDNKIELNIIDKNLDDDIDVEDDIKSMKTAEIEARFSAKKIKQLIKEQTYIPSEKQYRQIEFRDIVILMRSAASNAQIFEEVFFDEGIPFYSDTGSGYFETMEIQIMINILNLIDNFRQDIPLMSVLRSPIGGFTTEEMIQIRTTFPDTPYIDALFSYAKQYEDILSKKVKDFIKKINNWKNKCKYMSLHQLIWEILIDTGYYYFVGVLPNGNIRQANLRMLVDKTFEFEKTSMNGLFNFLRYIQKLNIGTGDVSTAKALSENDNVTRMMTIHKSKGLEFPVVIICGLDKKFNMRDTSKSILKHKRYGLAPKYIDLENRLYKETLPRTAFKNAIKIENLSEEMRVLYVALTRAIDKLILIGSVRNIETKSKKWKRGINYYSVFSASSYLDWICLAIYKHRDSMILRKIAEDEITQIEMDDMDSKWKIEVNNLKNISYSKAKEMIKRTSRLEEIRTYKNENNSLYIDVIEKRLNWTYEFSKSVNVPSKLSVTDLKKLTNKNIKNIKYKIPNLREIPFFKENEVEFTKQEIGTITHFVMQHLDLSQDLTENNILQQINSLVENKFLSEKEEKVINSKKISEFFETKLGKRMKSSSLVKREVPFVIKKEANKIIKNLDKNDTILIQGIIDCYFYEEDEIVLVDYKTDVVSDNNVKDIVKQYKPQILYYKEALEKITGKKVKESFLYLFDISKEIDIINYY